MFLARSELPETQIRKEEFTIDRELQKVIDFYEPAASDQEVRLEIQTASGILAPVDRTLFQIPVGNLVDRAVRHRRPGGHVTIAANIGAESLMVHVSDTGVGIPSQHRPHVFNRFYWADPARTHDGSGAGLGLAIVATIVRLHKGTVPISSSPGEGMSVTIVFPTSSAS